MTFVVPVLAQLFAAAAAGILGLVIGSFLNVVAYRVPAGISLLRESRCPSCERPVRWWQNVPVLSWLILRGRCHSCDAPIAARYPIVELATGLTFATITMGWIIATGRLGWGGTNPTALPARLDSFDAVLAAITHASAVSGPLAAQALVLAAYLWFAASGIVLTIIDLDVRRLPHVVTTWTLLACLVLLTVGCVLGADWWALARAGLGFLALFAFYALLRLAKPGGMGGGDVRLAGIVGLMAGWIGWGPLIVGAFGAFVLGGAFGVALLLRRRAGRRTAIPFGPWILAGAWVGIVVGAPIGQWYSGLLTGAV